MSVKYKIVVECQIERRRITNDEIVIYQNGLSKVFCNVIDNNIESHSSFNEINETIKKGRKLIKGMKK
ncbi:MAG: hypothetical protein N2Z20_01735 [Elusimicrobiales bacterium]|nr:hypothetical protein [Elusimicrobiales bacterium]